MQVKFNKELLLKHRFWVLLGASALLTLVGMFYLQLSVDAIQDKKAPEEVLKKAKGIGNTDFQNQTTISQSEEQAQKAQQQKAVIWRNAFAAQDVLHLWSPEIEKDFEFANGKFANEITLLPLNAENTWPADTETQIHGVFVELRENWLKIRTRKNKEGKDKVEKFFRTPRIASISVQGGNPISLADISKEQNKELREKKLWAVTYQVGRYFNDPLTPSEQELFKNSYKNQVYEILKLVQPLDTKDQGVVQLRNWRFDPVNMPDETKDAQQKFIRYVTKEWNTLKDFSVEAWIAQENLGIQKEIYTRIRAANDSISVLKAVDMKLIGKEGEEKNKPYSFKNSDFEVTLTLDNDQGLSAAIKNLRKQKVKLDNVQFRVQTNKGFEPELTSLRYESQEMIPYVTEINAAAIPGKESDTLRFAEFEDISTNWIAVKSRNGKSERINLLADSIKLPGEKKPLTLDKAKAYFKKNADKKMLALTTVMKQAKADTVTLEPAGTRGNKDTYMTPKPLPVRNMLRKGIYGVEMIPAKEWYEQANKPYVFRNSSFEITLTRADKGSLQCKIKNLQTKHQKLDDLRFRVKTKFDPEAEEDEVFSFSGPALKPRGDKDDTYVRVEPIPVRDFRTGIYSVEQVLSWDTAAVKRIDLISIGSNDAAEMSNSVRTYPDGLKPFEAPPEPKGPVNPQDANQPGRGGKGGGPEAKEIMEHGLWKDRYVEVSDQSRRIPVCIVLIVDQSHVDRVLTSFNNSRLRFLMTQISLNQYPGSLQPPPLPMADKKDGGGAVPMFPMPNFAPPGPGPRGPRGGAFVQPGGVAGPQITGGTDVAPEANIELVVYGIVTLYQRYPLRPPMTATKKQ